MIAGCVAEGAAIHVDHDKGDEPRVSLLDLGEIGIASLAVPRFDRREFRHRDQDLTNSLDDLLLFCRSEPGQAERLVLHFNLTRAAQVEFIECFDPVTRAGPTEIRLGRWQAMRRLRCFCPIVICRSGRRPRNALPVAPVMPMTASDTMSPCSRS